MRVVVSVPQYYVHIRKDYVSKRGFDGFFYGLFVAFYISLGFFLSNISYNGSVFHVFLKLKIYLFLHYFRIRIHDRMAVKIISSVL